MTQDELKIKIYRLQICSANLADSLVDNLTLGDKSCKTSFNNITILNDIINLLLKYNLTEGATNCLTLTDFENLHDKAINICKLCDCE